jgi:FtsP/CotA-like multicopper oxidase with cupredoxin domain
MPAQFPENPDLSGVNPFGRWMYGPWFYPPTVIKHGPVANPYHDPDCSSTNPYILADCQTPGQNSLNPATPHPSMGMEAFSDTAVVNGTAFPVMEVDPRAYRFRILSAANDRGFNLSFYKADGTGVSPDNRRKSNLTEVKMVDAAVTPGWPELWPTDGRVEGVPDPGTPLGNGRWSNWGPSFIQIGTDAGFLPKPAIRDPQPVTWITDPTAFWVGVVKDTALGLMPAERADVIVDFCGYAGQTLILYNDAPA